ncbi:sugar kinase [Microcella alkaliphila]|uniref:PfkB domain protein n=1 Tax=Microcella alkaliphila TaxID=279828 RepID=A0A0U5CDC8_9MICO|nr:sugar kinase [Microcella alkaliphila]BAU31058.1 PfkB domain protein [Microcella alkaliphila]
MNGATHRVLCIGEAMAMVTPSSPGPLATSDQFTVSAGGAESNVASHLAGLGLESIWLSRLGDDALGDRILTALAERGVDLSRVIRDPSARTGVYFKDPLPGRHATVSYYRDGSAASRMSVDDLRRWPMGSATWVHTSGITAAISPSCSELVEQVISDASGLGYCVSFDVNYRPALWSEADAAQRCLQLGRSCSVLFVGLDEAQLLWGVSAAEDVANLFDTVPHVVVKDGAVEAVEITQASGIRDVTRVPAKSVEVVEAVGAGDAFAAGFLAGYLRGHPSHERLSAGHELAAWTLGTLADFRPFPSTHDPIGSTPQ